MEHAKTRLHNRVTGHGWNKPKLDFAGPFNGQGSAPPQWLCIVRIDGAEWGRGYGPSRSAASEAAATDAYNKMIREGF